MQDGERATEPAGAWVDGVAVCFDVAVIEAARRLAASAAPLFSHLNADVAGVREAILLAERLGGVLDHAQSPALLADLDPIREAGGMQTTPLEAARADALLLVGDSVFEAWPELGSRLLDRLKPGARVFCLQSQKGAPAGVEAIVCGTGAARLTFLATLRARAKPLPFVAAAPEIERLAGNLRAAKFGVAVWSAAELEPLAIAAMHGLVRELNETTRFSTLALAPPDNALGVQTVCGWMTGFPPRIGFALGRPEHDPWRFDARRLIAAGETDCVVWVSAFAARPPSAPVDIALCAAQAPVAAKIRFTVGRPGVDHDAILYDPRVGTLVAHSGADPAATPTVAHTLAAIRAHLDGPPC